jgi:hypothetical protein
LAKTLKEDQMLKIVWLDKYDGYGMAAPMYDIYAQLELVENNYDVQLFQADRVIKLNVPFSEIFHRCTLDEWKSLLQYVEEHFGERPTS